MTTPYAGIDSFPATIPLPQDSVDKRNASVFNTCYQGLMDAVRWLKNRTGAYRVVAFDDSASSSGSATLISTSDATYGTAPYELGDVAVEAGDLVKISVDAHVAIGLSASTGEIKLYTLIGANPPVDVPGGVNILATSFTTEKSVHVAGVAHAAHTGTMRVFLDAKVAGGQTLLVEQPIACSIEAIRSNA